MMTMTEQRQKYLKAKVALALYSEFGQVSKEDEIDHGYHLTRVLYKAVFGTHYTNSGNAIVEYGHESPNQADAASDGGGAGGALSAGQRRDKTESLADHLVAGDLRYFGG